MKFKPGVKKLLLEQGYDMENGARPMKRAVQRLIEDKLATEIVDGMIKPGDIVEVSAKDGLVELKVRAS